MGCCHMTFTPNTWLLVSNVFQTDHVASLSREPGLDRTSHPHLVSRVSPWYPLVGPALYHKLAWCEAQRSSILQPHLVWRGLTKTYGQWVLLVFSIPLLIPNNENTDAQPSINP